jgi:single-strand DNA-binding protein
MNALRSTVNWTPRKWPRNQKILMEGKINNFTLATNESYKNDKGEKVEENWWQLPGENGRYYWEFVTKGKEIAIEGKLTHSYDKTKTICYWES